MIVTFYYFTSAISFKYLLATLAAISIQVYLLIYELVIAFNVEQKKGKSYEK